MNSSERQAQPFMQSDAVGVSNSNALLAGVITDEQKQILQNNIDEYIRFDCVMSRHSLDIIQKLLDAC